MKQNRFIDFHFNLILYFLIPKSIKTGKGLEVKGLSIFTWPYISPPNIRFQFGILEWSFTYPYMVLWLPRTLGERARTHAYSYTQIDIYFNVYNNRDTHTCIFICLCHLRIGAYISIYGMIQMLWSCSSFIIQALDNFMGRLE